MKIVKRTQTLLSIEQDNRTDALKAVRNTINVIDGVVVKKLLYYIESVDIVADIKNAINSSGINISIIVDTRLEPDDFPHIGAISGRLKEKGAEAMTIVGIYGSNCIEPYIGTSQLPLLSIIDADTPLFNRAFGDEVILKNAIGAKESGCEGIVMTSRHLKRIERARQALDETFLIFATVEQQNEFGKSIQAGADFEIASLHILKFTKDEHKYQ